MAVCLSLPFLSNSMWPLNLNFGIIEINNCFISLKKLGKIWLMRIGSHQTVWNFYCLQLQCGKIFSGGFLSPAVTTVTEWHFSGVFVTQNYAKPFSLWPKTGNQTVKNGNNSIKGLCALLFSASYAPLHPSVRPSIVIAVIVCGGVSYLRGSKGEGFIRRKVSISCL